MHPQCQPASTSHFPSLFSPPQPSPWAAIGRTSSQASVSSCHQEHVQSWLLQENPWKNWGAAGICCTREETFTELFLCQETLDPGPGTSKTRPSIHMSVSGLRVLTLQDCSPSPSLRGCCSLQMLVAGSLLPHFQGRARPGDLRSLPLGSWGEPFPP